MQTTTVTQALDDAVTAGIPGVIAGVTTRSGTEYAQGRGVRVLGSPDPVSADSVFALYSASKPITATAALQCVEDGILNLDLPASTYLPELESLRVLERIDEDGSVHTRPPRFPLTPRMLLLHTSGIGYDMFNADLAKLGRLTPPSSLRDSLRAPLLHDPGERWTYGMSLDILGLIVQEVRGERLDSVLRQRIFEPCGMTSTSFDMTASMRERLIPAHRRKSDGSIVATSVQVPDVAELDMGGQGLFSSVPDYLAFLRVWLGDGSAAHGRVLHEDTVTWAAKSAPGVIPTRLDSAIPALTHSVDFTAGNPVSWAYSFLRNDSDVPGKRRAGTLSWAGLANVHFWIDRASGVAAVWSAQLLPWQDPAAVAGFDAFERAVYLPDS